MNSVQQLHMYRKSLSTKPFNARGWRVKRCQRCLISAEYCICEHRQSSDSDVGFALIMSDGEVLKPSNTGRLIADIVPNTFAFLWKRNEPDAGFLTLIADEQWQPVIVFPREYALPEQPEFQTTSQITNGKKPLFIIIDASWREARRMFRKSPYLHHLPMLSFAANNPENEAVQSRYLLREASKNSHLATAEVAAKTLRFIGDANTATHIDLWLDLFIYQYQKGVCQPNKGNEMALEQLQHFYSTDTK